MTIIINTLVLTIDKVEKKTHKIVIVLERCPAAPDTAISNLVPARGPWPVARAIVRAFPFGPRASLLVPAPFVSSWFSCSHLAGK